ncbi:hypothetical protein I350_01665 [Cryptococcus amylolentus CBS 6273]|uniref:Amino acid permease/ SLC12A domain-containing protein n=1 Tax=Cryptococcus amylolentus CBS 6273 TaxID=1296118 RepID=A0A1E3KDU7_9TREE|nr:hypothetical protein I350_01665 [Cryptococcus amylolentus CBS 6273]
MSEFKEYGYGYSNDNKKAEDYTTTEVLPADDIDVEPPGVDNVPHDDDGLEDKYKLKREMKSRHMQLIGIGSAIGTGLFLGTAPALADGGPLGLLLGYTLMGAVCVCLMVSVGEMIAFYPVPGGHIRLAERFVDPALAFTMGYNMIVSSFVSLPSELSAGAVLINMWNTDISNGVWITCGLLLVIALNLFGPGVYGEAEFWFCSIKVLCVLGLMLLGIILTAGGGPNGEVIGFKYWKDPGPFVQYEGISGSLGAFLGWWAVLLRAGYAYLGTEGVALAAGEARNPRRTVPRAIKTVYVRIIFFYIVTVFLIGMVIPSNDSSLSLSSGNALSAPFVIAIRRAGIPALPSIVNACLLTSAWSAGSAGVYTSSRSMYGLAKLGIAPKIWMRTNRYGTPWVGVLTVGLFGGLSYMTLDGTASEVFNYFTNLTSACGLLTWWGMCFTYIRFNSGLRAQGISRSSLPYASVINYRALAAWFALIWCSLILFFSGWSNFLKIDGESNWSTSGFITNYMPVWLYPMWWIGYKLVKKSKFVRSNEMDFVTGIAEFDVQDYKTEAEMAEKKPWYKRIFNVFM